MALHLADRGVDVIVTYESGERAAHEVASAIRAKGRKSAALALDVASSKTFASFAGTLKEELHKTWQNERFDYLVNNAGSGAHAAFAETTEEQFDEMMNVHLKSTFFLTEAPP